MKTRPGYKTSRAFLIAPHTAVINEGGMRAVADKRGLPA